MITIALTAIVVLLGIIMQLRFFILTKENIHSIRDFIPHRNCLSVKYYTILASDLEHESIPEIVKNLEQYQKLAEELENKKTIKLPLISLSPDHSYSDSFTEIVRDINIYLLRNYGAIADFNIINSLITRKLEELKDKAGSFLYTPLYIGLLATILGVILGLWDFGTIEIDNTNTIISTFIRKIIFTMIVSMLGLVLVIVSNFKLSKNIQQQENNKNAIISLLQIELMPVMNKDMNDSILQLQRSLTQFNTDFKDNTKAFFQVSQENAKSFQEAATSMNNLIKLNSESLHTQLKLIDEIKSTRIQNIVDINFKILSKLTDNLEKFDQLAIHANSITETLKKTTEIVNILNKIVIQNKSFESITQFIEERSNTIQAMLDKYEITVNNIENNITDTLEEIQTSFSKRIKTVHTELEQTFNNFISIIPEFHENVSTAFSELSASIKESIASIQAYEEKMLNKLNATEEGIFLQNLRHLEPIAENQFLLNRQLFLQIQIMEDLKIILSWLTEIQTERNKNLFRIPKQKLDEITEKYQDLHTTQQSQYSKQYQTFQEILSKVDENKDTITQP